MVTVRHLIPVTFKRNGEELLESDSVTTKGVKFKY